MAAAALRVRTEPPTSADGLPVRVRPGRRTVAIVLMLPQAARVWLEDAVGGDAGIEALSVRRIGRARAFARMLSSCAGRWRLLPSLAATALCLGARAAGDLLLARYQQDLAGAASVRPAAFVHPLAWMPWARLARPLHAGRRVEPAGAGDDAGWVATDDDPSFLVDLGGLPALGWCRFRTTTVLREGRLVAPCLYPDYGRGHAADERIPLPEPDGDGRIDALVLLRSPARSLRFDPSVRTMRFVQGDVRLQRLGRARALARMLADAWRAGHRLAAVDFLRDLFRPGLAAAVDALARRGSLAEAREDYAEWVRRYDTVDARDLPLLAQRAGSLAVKPLISLILPVYETPERWLRRCLDSVLSQAYPNWELCIADDASSSPHVGRVLREYQARDSRIRVAFRETNGHISEASNTALALARGEFVGLLDHDDELRPHALLEMAQAIAEHPRARLLYSDEDKIDADGRRFQPNFKPGWNPDLLLSQNYVCHFTVIRADLVRATGGFRTGFEGSQDHDLFLRCAARLADDEVHHVSRVLYHWRAVEGSTALARGEKDYASAAGARAVAEHVRAIDSAARVEELPHGHYRVRWSLPDPAPRVSIIVPTRDRADLLRACVDSVTRLTRYPDFELVVVDNRSSEPDALAYLASLRAEGRARILSYDAPFNYSALNNWAVAQCDGAVLCLLNNDVEAIEAGWLEEMVVHALRPGVGAVGAMLFYPDDTIQHAGVILGLGGIANHAFVGRAAGDPGYCARAWATQNLSAVTGACLVVRRDAFAQVGGLDERLQVAFNDIDFCLRLRQAGYRNVWTPFAKLYHHESASRGSDADAQKRARFLGEVRLMEERWGRILEDDPAYNPNLSLEGAGFEPAFPPRAGRPAGR